MTPTKSTVLSLIIVTLGKHLSRDGMLRAEAELRDLAVGMEHPADQRMVDDIADALSDYTTEHVA